MVNPKAVTLTFPTVRYKENMKENFKMSDFYEPKKAKNISGNSLEDFRNLVKQSLESLNAPKSGQAWLARKTGISQGYLSTLLSGNNKKKPSETIIRKIAAALDVQASTLLMSAGIDPQKSEIPFVIGISGPSGGGKTWFSQKIEECEPNLVSRLSLDNFYLADRQKVNSLQYTYDNPQSIDFGSAKRALILLKSEREVTVPEYCYKTGTRVSETTISPHPIIVVEGHMLFTDSELVKDLDCKVWIDADLDIALSRRLKRDSERFEGVFSSTEEHIENVVKKWRDEVVPAYHQFIRHTRSHADILVNNNNQSKNSNDIPMAAKAIVAYVKQLIN
jgi:uridine kinase